MTKPIELWLLVGCGFLGGIALGLFFCSNVLAGTVALFVTVAVIGVMLWLDGRD